MGIAMILTILFSYGLMITLNAHANILAINGLGTGQISDAELFVSLLLMLLILMCLMTASIALSKIKLSSIEWWTIKLPFSVYFGWITVAT